MIFLPRQTPTQGLNNPKETLIPKANTCHLVPWNFLLQPNAKLRGKKKPQLFIKLNSFASHSTVLLYFTLSRNSRIQPQLIVDFMKQRVNSLCLNTFVSHFVPIPWTSSRDSSTAELSGLPICAPGSFSRSSPDLKALKSDRNLGEDVQPRQGGRQSHGFPQAAYLQHRESL